MSFIFESRITPMILLIFAIFSRKMPLFSLFWFLYHRAVLRYYFCTQEPFLIGLWELFKVPGNEPRQDICEVSAVPDTITLIIKIYIYVYYIFYM